MAKPYSVCMQIPHVRSENKSFTQSEIGDLYPYYGNTIEIKNDDISKIKQWYKDEKELTVAQKIE
ncbi:hypothetical protein [Vibrio parahaemolyticus]|uniref:hypothetical protein n=1 Tax=Vibrio parahaemolyticus TaxID=670 RepID=UPI00226A93A3|nr:hypothetical protein [Vibrio parahaemolyticus]MCX8788098.1 hypothetical protein [Vibrio parahaemolyticus]MCX8849076.1 hypothetical protein [Vibrio parahaemolyticus]